jgi:predicted component of type VI protein secretion system
MDGNEKLENLLTDILSNTDSQKQLSDALNPGGDKKEE